MLCFYCRYTRFNLYRFVAVSSFLALLFYPSCYFVAKNYFCLHLVCKVRFDFIQISTFANFFVFLFLSHVLEQGRAQKFKRGEWAQNPCQLTFSERRAFVLASTSAGPIFLILPNDCGFLAIVRVKRNSKILL